MPVSLPSSCLEVVFLVGTVVGYRRVAFRADDGADISGTKVYCTFSEEGTEGLSADSFFLRDRQGVYTPVLDDIVMVDRNSHGRVVSCQSLNSFLDRHMQ